MQSIFHIPSPFGLPLCLSGVTQYHHLSLSTQIADHDRIRNEMKRAKTESRNVIPVDEIDGEVRETEAVIRSSDLMIFNLDDGDGDHDHDRHSPFAAKAA